MKEAERVMKWCQAGTWNSNEANNLHAECYRVIGKLLKTIEEMESQEPEAWIDRDGYLYKKPPKDLDERHPPYTPLYTRTLQKRKKVVFPTMLRKMWSGSEVQAWLDEHVNKEKS